MRDSTLREGFTTGSAASTAAAMATRILLHLPYHSSLEIPLPPFPSEKGEESRRLTIPVQLASQHVPADRPDNVSDGLFDNVSGGLSGTTSGDLLAEEAVETRDWQTICQELAVHSTPIQLPLGRKCSTPQAVSSMDNASGQHATVSTQPLTEHIQSCQVIKDGGDDPDATHGAVIQATVRLLPDQDHLTLRAGIGVGRVTLPGLPVAVGNPAINPQPQLQIAAAVAEACDAAGYTGGVEVVITVPEGLERATRTLNSRLGILDGISILGTRGTVKPFSHSSWKATITQGMDVARAADISTVGISTGRRSEKLLMREHPHLPELAFVQAADFVAFALQEAAQKGFSRIAWGCFYGKLVKLAQGHAYTHARTAPIDFPLLAQWSAQAGLDAERVAEIATANTARQVLEIMQGSDAMQNVLDAVTLRAQQKAQEWVTTSPATASVSLHISVSMYLFDFDGRLLAQAPHNQSAPEA